MDECPTNDIPQVSTQENTRSPSPYTEDEVKNVIFQTKHKTRDRMDSYLSSTRTFRMSLKWIC
jgi:hypothetical protein